MLPLQIGVFGIFAVQIQFESTLTDAAFTAAARSQRTDPWSTIWEIPSVGKYVGFIEGDSPTNSEWNANKYDVN